MKINLLFIFLICFPAFLYCQNDSSKVKNPYDVNFSVNSQQEPFFPAGDQVLYTFLFNNIQYSDSAKAKLINGSVMISFDVMPDSTIANAIVLSNVGYGIDEEVLHLVGKLKYAPGIQNGQATKMNVILMVPVKTK